MRGQRYTSRARVRAPCHNKLLSLRAVASQGARAAWRRLGGPAGARAMLARGRPVRAYAS